MQYKSVDKNIILDHSCFSRSVNYVAATMEIFSSLRFGFGSSEKLKFGLNTHMT